MNLALELAQVNSLFIPAAQNSSRDANEPQDMHVWPGLVMMARCKSGVSSVKNGMRYKLLALEADRFTFAGVTDEGEELGQAFPLAMEEMATMMRLTHAITYFSSQARTIHGSLRLEDTRNNKVGLGRAPRGCDVQVV